MSPPTAAPVAGATGAPPSLGEVEGELAFVTVELDATGRIASLSPEWEALTGHATAASIGTEHDRYLTPEHRAARSRSLGEVLARPGALQFGETELQRADGSTCRVEVRWGVMLDETGQPCGYRAVLLDVTRRTAAQALAAWRARDLHAQTLLEQGHVGIFRCTPLGELVDVSPAFTQMLGYGQPAQLLGVNIFSALRRPEGSDGDYLAPLFDGSATSTAAAIWPRPDGAEVRLHLTLSGERGADGELRLLHGLAENVTERMRREEVIRRGQRMASLGRTLSGVAHEINNPLAAISGFAQLLLKRSHAPEDQHALETILQEARRSARIVKDLLTIARREEGGARSRVDVTAIVQYIVESQRYALETRGVTVTLRAPDDPIRVLADGAQLEQVVLNLVLHARQALTTRMERPRDAAWTPVLEVTLALAGGTLVLDLAHNGTGIPASDVAHIWDPYWATRDEGEGAGLALAIVHSVVTAHGGTIDLASPPTGGTHFRLQLPGAFTAAPPPEAPLLRPSPVPDVAARPLDVLVVDDEVAIRDLLVRCLERRGHAVMQAGAGEEALRLAAQSSFDVVISDLLMPGMDGLELLRRLRALPADAPARFILSTGDVTVTRRRASGDGLAPDAIVAKPYDVDALLALVEQA